MDKYFHDRYDAGRQLAGRLAGYAGREDGIVLALPRGGVPVGFEVARALGAPLDVFVVRKLGVPGHEELAMGAIASGGARVRNEDVARHLSDADALIEAAVVRENRELLRRERTYREGRPAPDLQDRRVILVDDGLATGSTMRVAIMALRKCRVGGLVVAVPVGASETCTEIEAEVDALHCLHAPPCFHSVGQFYEDFSQTTDDEVRDLLMIRAVDERMPR